MSEIFKFKNCNIKVALLGGSFDPPHAGHLAISEQLLKKGFDYVWWIVAKQNPLKSNYVSSFKSRFDLSKLITQKNSKIIVSDIEMHTNLNHSFDIIIFLKNYFRRISFAWVIGADNLINFHKWFKAKQIVKLLPVVVFNRRYYFYKSLHSYAKKFFKSNVSVNCSKTFNKSKALPWLYMLKIKNYDYSSTDIRRENIKYHNIY